MTLAWLACLFAIVIATNAGRPLSRKLLSMTPAQREQVVTAARDAVLAALPHAWAIYVYGSIARGDEWPGSDLDLAVLLPPGERITDKLALISEISMRVGREVDLIDLRAVSDVLRREVLADGRVLHVSHRDHVLLWEASAMTRYGYHREEIREILDDFRRTGIGYGR